MSHRYLETPVQMNKELCWPWKWIVSAGMDPGKLFLRLQLPHPSEPWSQLPNLQGDLTAQSSQFAVVAVKLHKCCSSVQVRLLAPHLLLFCGKRVCPLFPTSVPLLDVGSWHELLQLLYSGHIYEWHFVYLLLVKQAWSLVLFPLPLKRLWTHYWPETSAVFYRIDVCIGK